MANVSKKALKRFIKKMVLVWAGACSLALGVLGIILPVLPGIVFVFIGLILISRGSSTFRGLLFVELLISKTRHQAKQSQNRIFQKILTLL
jgi:uncharacterized membrane protein YbaN (DUF454 family)